MANATLGVRPARKHPTVVAVPYGFRRLRRHGVAPELSRDARARLAMLDWHRAHGRNVSPTARHFGYSRPTVYRWLRRFEGTRLETLEDRSSAPRRRRRPTWTTEELAAVRAVRERYPRWGKDKLAVLLRRDGIAVSTSRGHRRRARARCLPGRAAGVGDGSNTIRPHRSLGQRTPAEFLASLGVHV